MATVTSEFPSKPISYTNTNTNTSTKTYCLRSVKRRVTTCLQQLREKLPATGSFRKSSTSRFHRFFIKSDFSDFSEKLQKIFKSARKSESPELRRVPLSTHDQQTSGQSSQQLQIVARLFSSTLISTKEITFNNHTKNSFSYKCRKSEGYSSNMTIIEGNYIDVREENPDIDAEVRAILLTHAQNGITISSIKSEYRKLTGNPFPLHDNVTDFLLTIPNVTAECSETGKRIFNLKANLKNRHLLDMVLNQKQKPSDNSSEAPTVEDKSRVPPRYWKNPYKRRALSQLDNNLNTVHKLTDDQAKAMSMHTRAAPLQQLAKVAAESNWCYQDNWKHLNNFYQQSSVNEPQRPVPINIYTDALEDLPIQLDNPEHHPNCKNNNQNIKQNVNQHLGNFVNPLNDVNPFKRRQDITPTPTIFTSGGSSNNSLMTINSDYDAFLLDFPLMGDDFMLYLARMELKCRFKRHERVLQSGLCASGQTINGARNRLRKVQLPEGTQIIVNIGSVDIMKGKPLVQIEHDFRLLIKEMHNQRYIPILTNLAPLANYCHDKVLCDKITRFNKFIASEGRHLKVINIHSCLINERGIVRFDCFQSSPRQVTGSQEPYLFWNKIGRQRVLQVIESSLEY
ncbi:maternal effect protein oskar isoform X1 [Drosophila eugracilis]|uniref:maternal effect protein oskar isoform X1 n=1 Tax=Drosophila eugracilis TaxID=29029 RepID=UPI001BD9913F|nr:maternal effect protein oskar isoform X1 [Drosophila eugracilis]